MAVARGSQRRLSALIEARRRAPVRAKNSTDREERLIPWDVDGLKELLKGCRNLSSAAEGQQEGKLSWNVPRRGCVVYSVSQSGFQSGVEGTNDEAQTLHLQSPCIS